MVGRETRDRKPTVKKVIEKTVGNPQTMSLDKDPIKEKFTRYETD